VLGGDEEGRLKKKYHKEFLFEKSVILTIDTKGGKTAVAPLASKFILKIAVYN